jgi:glycerophosphoryl diester phosphodiesterase
MDVCETKDGVLVVHHDHELERTCGVEKFIRDLEYKDLPKFKEEI